MQHDAVPHNDLQLKSVLSGVRYMMLTTRGERGPLASRPLQLLELDDAGFLWFFTARSSRKVRDIRHDANVNVAFADQDRKIFVSVDGRAELVVDRDKAAHLWSAMQTVFFPLGREDPELVLLKITPVVAHYWDGRESILGTIIKLGKAVISGQAQDLGTSAKIPLA